MRDAEVSSVEIDGLRVAYRRAGRGPPILILHGILSDSRAWTAQLQGLSDELTAIAWDAPGAGASSDPPEDFSAADYADCLAAFIELLECEPAHILGLSWGGVLAQELYRRHPEQARSLILADTYAGWRGSLPEAVCEARLASCIRESELPPEEWVGDWMPGLLTAGASRRMREEVEQIMSEFHPAGYRAMARALAVTDTRELLPRIDVPTLLIWGEADQRSPLAVAERMREGIPGAELIVLADTGHESNVEQPAAFNAAVLDFCRRVEHPDGSVRP